MIGPEVVEGKARPLYIYAERAERAELTSCPLWRSLKLRPARPIFASRRLIPGTRHKHCVMESWRPRWAFGTSGALKATGAGR